jgi:hypothetical protein
MDSLERRLANLERLSASRHEGRSDISRSLEAYFRALENLDREKAGLPPLPYTEEDWQDDEEFLLETPPPTERAWDGKQRRRSMP